MTVVDSTRRSETAEHCSVVVKLCSLASQCTYAPSIYGKLEVDDRVSTSAQARFRLNNSALHGRHRRKPVELLQNADAQLATSLILYCDTLTLQHFETRTSNGRHSSGAAYGLISCAFCPVTTCMKRSMIKRSFASGPSDELIIGRPGILPRPPTCNTFNQQNSKQSNNLRHACVRWLNAFNATK